MVLQLCVVDLAEESTITAARLALTAWEGLYHFMYLNSLLGKDKFPG